MGGVFERGWGEWVKVQARGQQGGAGGGAGGFLTEVTDTPEEVRFESG